MTDPHETGRRDAIGQAPHRERPGDAEAGTGTIGYWFWGSLLAFGAFLVLVPGRDTRARFWLVAGLVLAVASAVGLARVARARARRRTSGP